MKIISNKNFSVLLISETVRENRIVSDSFYIIKPFSKIENKKIFDVIVLDDIYFQEEIYGMKSGKKKLQDWLENVVYKEHLKKYA